MVGTLATIVAFYVMCTSSSPIILETLRTELMLTTPGACQLPASYGHTGRVQFLEDCPTLSPDLLPIPTTLDRSYGTHALVCCPPQISKDAICFPSDPGCPSNTNMRIKQEPLTRVPTMADEDCGLDNGKPHYLKSIGRNLSLCVRFDECEQLLNQPLAPQTAILECGFDTTHNKLKICCPKDYVGKARQPRKDDSLARFPDKRGKPRQCKDRHDHCSSWRDIGGCKLDQHLVKENFQVFSDEMFRLMELSCMATCGWCGDRGCVDDHPTCQTWTKQGMCVHNPLFMAHTCRESCGLCGFLGNDDNEEQVVGSASYTVLSRDNFVCGGEQTATGNANENEVLEKPTDKVEVFSSSADDICGATLLTDKWCIGAAHCFDDFSSQAAEKIQMVRIRTEREAEVIDVKRVFKHPGYKYPSLYNDIALLFHGRRIHFDSEYEDSPVCLDMQKDHEGELGRGEAWRAGKRYFGSKYEGMARIISNDKFKEYLKYNISRDTFKSDILKQKVKAALPSGLHPGLMYAIGQYNPEISKFQGPCKGDSGGSLVVRDGRQRKTMAGIVSGGLGCGEGYPGWYTKVAAYVEWICCVMEATVELGYDYDRVEQACQEVAEREQRENTG